MSEELTHRIEKLIMPCIVEASACLVEWHLKRRGKTAVLEVVADKEHGGITIEECARLNRRLAEELDKTLLLGEDYTVEVSSPGLDRPLKTCEDFSRVTGCRVQFYLRERVENRLEYAGVVQRAQEDKVVVRVKDTSVELPLEKIQKAVQVIEM